MFDRFPIDVRWLGECCRSIGGGLEGWRRIGGRLEKDRRKAGEALEEDWRRFGGGWVDRFSIDVR